jgi:hypothetical protein
MSALTIKEKIAKLREVKEQISDKISELYKQLESESAVELNQKLKGKYFRVYNNLNKMGGIMSLSDYSVYYITEVLFEGNGFIRCRCIEYKITYEEDDFHIEVYDDTNTQGENLNIGSMVEITREDFEKIIIDDEQKVKNIFSKVKEKML